MMKRACADLQLPKKCKIFSESCTKIMWNNVIFVSNLKAIFVYNTLTYDESIIMHANNMWFEEFSVKQWQKIFSRLWTNPSTPKQKCFRWLMIINKLSFRKDHNNTDICKMCRVAESIRHIFFECSIAREIWLLFGIFIPQQILVLDVLIG